MDVIANCTGTGHRRVSVDDNVCNNSVIGGGGGGPGRGERGEDGDAAAAASKKVNKSRHQLSKPCLGLVVVVLRWSET